MQDRVLLRADITLPANTVVNILVQRRVAIVAKLLDRIPLRTSITLPSKDGESCLPRTEPKNAGGRDSALEGNQRAHPSLLLVPRKDGQIHTFSPSGLDHP